MKSMTTTPDNNLNHIADFYNRYPGEEIQFFTRLEADAVQPGRRLSILLPTGLELLDSRINQPSLSASNSVREDEENLVIDWQFADVITLEEKFEIITRVRVLPVNRDENYTCSAELRDEQGYTLTSCSTRVKIHSQSSYMKYLPEIFGGNEFLGRFLMLFESFWHPVEMQINQGEYYYDPDLTPVQFLPWLASWIGVAWDEQLPDNRKRQLLSSALQIYQKRGTREALELILEIYTGGKVQIIEHRTRNFILGSGSSLGQTIALGRNNYPHTFTVNLHVSSNEVYVQSGIDKAQQVKKYKQSIAKLIETQKPAHTAARINLLITQANLENSEATQLA